VTAALDHNSLTRWRRQPIRFVEEVLCDPETKKPFKLLPAERVFLQHAFKTDKHGRLLYPEQVYSCPKKSGKTTFAAIHALVVTLLFGGGYPEATLCANDEEQARGRVFEMVRRIVESSPLLRHEAEIIQSQIRFPALRAIIQAIGSDFGSAAGGNQCISVFDELWAYSTERAHRLWDELVPPPTRKIACRLTVTYAGFENESTVLEALYKRGLRQPLIAPGLYAGDGLLMFWSHEPIAPWQDERWLAEMRRSLRPNQYLRVIENRFVTTEESFVDMSWYDQCVVPTMTPLVSSGVLPVWVGVDASVKRDASAVAVCSFDNKAQQVKLIWHRIFQPTPDDPLNFEQTIESTLLDLKKRFLVRKVLYDPYQMHASAQRLVKTGVRMEEFPQSAPNLTEASTHLYELIKGRSIAVYPDADIRLAVSRAVAVEGSRGWKISKTQQSHKIDIVIALGMAALAAVRGQSEYDYSLDWVDGDVDDDQVSKEQQWAEWEKMRYLDHILRTGGAYRRW
jgi:hypothetical protein